MDSLGLLIFPLFLGSVFSADWGYYGSKGPSHWGDGYPICDEKSQSPINIYEGDAKANGISEAFTMTNYDTAEGVTMTLSNNGHTAVVALTGSTFPEVSGGGLGSTFRAAQFHFHWGSSNDQGSEHFISSMAYPMEVHIVHYNTKYPSIGRAINESDGLAVLGFMFEVSNAENNNYDYIVGGLPKITDRGKSTTITTVSLASLLPNSYRDFYRYQGSLTTPACYESVTWTVFKDPIKISQGQLDAFREIRDIVGSPLLNNYRPIQPRNDRPVFASFNPDIQWSYDYGHVTSQRWSEYYEACGAEKQSPINIPTSAATVRASLGNLTFNNYNTNTGFNMTMKNNGHTVQVDFQGGDMSVEDGELTEPYKVAQFHLHWGSTSMKGSEHTTDSTKYPMELHIVHYKTSLGDLGSAAGTPNGLAVVGIFFEISNTDNPSLEPLMSKLTDITEPKTNVAVDPFRLDTLLPDNPNQFFRYDGSLTTPGCYESVIWTVLHNTITVSESQMAKLRALKSSDINENSGAKYPIVDNFRPVQTLNTRPIYSNFHVVSGEKPSWGYFGLDGPQYWGDHFQACANTETSRQSPIDIVPTTVTYDNSFADFSFQGFDTTTGVNMNISNNGHNVVVSYIAGHPTVRGGGLTGTYKVAQFHFHWGSTATVGSEHTIDGQSFPMELHIVTFNTIYDNIGIAMSQSNGLAVLGFMFEIDDTNNANYNSIVNALPSIIEPKADVSLTTFELSSLIPSDVLSFYRYDGSLTTPGCDESVTWTVFRESIPISESQLSAFRALKSSDKDDQDENILMIDNFRPPQPLNNRIVRANFYISASDRPASSSRTFIPMSLVLLAAQAFS